VGSDRQWLGCGLSWQVSCSLVGSAWAESWSGLKVRLAAHERYRGLFYFLNPIFYLIQI
jgi:hypothetical protein